MKKILYALLVSLALSVVLCALFPNAFLTDDALWTHKSGFGRIDIAFAGEVRDGQINVQGNALRVDRPKWMRDGMNNQGVMIYFPVFYLQKNYQMTLTPSGETKEILLVMRFRGAYYPDHNKAKPAWVRFENIRLNGKLVAQEEIVWHDKPFICRAQSVEIGQNLTLNFDIQKPFSFADIRWDRVIGLFILCSLFIFPSYDITRGFVRNIIGQKGVMLSDVGRLLKLHKQKILTSAILTLLANILCIPLWTEISYGSFMRTLFNKEARLDLLYEGKTSSEAPFQLQSTPQPLNDPSPFFTFVANFQQSKLNFRARGKWQKLLLQLESQRDGKITLRLKGPWMIDDYGRLYSVLTDWQNFKINGTVLFDENKALSFQNVFSKQIPVKKNEILNIEAEFRRHHFTIRDFKFLKSGHLWYFVTGNLLFFFLLLRLFSAFAKCRGRARLSDALLLVAFFCCLSVPMMDISDEQKSQRENRMLAVKPKLKEILKGNIDTGGGVWKMV